MAITREEYLAKKQIMDKLAREGYPTYAHLLDLFDLNLTSDPKVVGYMIPDQGVIVLNRNLDIDQVSTIVRHEILHEYLSHQLRMQRHLGQDAYDKRSPTIHQLINIAGDYEISNRGYTEKDKAIVRAIKLNGEVLKGLVTEDEHPDWVDMSIEEMFDELYKQYEKDMEKLKPLLDLIQQLNQQMDSDIQKAEQIEREANDISDQLEGQSGNGKGDDESDNDSDGSSDSDDDKKGEDQPGRQHQKGGKVKDLGDESEQAKEIAKAAKEVSKDAKEHSEEKGNDVFDSPADNARKVKIAKKVKAIEKAFNELKDNIQLEDEAHLRKDRAAKADNELKKYREDPITNFKISLYDLIKREVAIERENSWSRPNRRYQGTGIYAQGRAIKPNPIPKVNVYFDVSGSVHPYVETTRAALAVLRNFVSRGLIKVNVYYVSTIISDNENESTGGGADGDLIMGNIQATHPDNVIIMTDGDADGSYKRTEIPGGVYFLFPNKNYIPNGLISALHGARANKTFYLTKER